jgi:hypothetical protein
MSANVHWRTNYRSSFTEPLDILAGPIANIELENANGTATGDIATVFGNPSPELTEGATNSTLAAADFEGIAIHCAQNSSICAASPHAVPTYSMTSRNRTVPVPEVMSASKRCSATKRGWHGRQPKHFVLAEQ